MAWRVRSTETVASDQLTVSIDCGATSTGGPCHQWLVSTIGERIAPV